MAGKSEILKITKRNTEIARECEEKTNNTYAKGYFKGKQDAINHIMQLMTEGDINGR